MKKTEKLLSLLMVVLLMSAATITVKKSIFGHNLVSDSPEQSVDSITAAVTYNADGSAVIHTASPAIEGKINGYAGPVDFDIIISKNGEITSVNPVPNSETPSFFDRAVVIIENWIGKTPSEGMHLKPDAVSGATYSSQAIVQNIDAGLAYYHGSKAENTASTPWKIWIALAVTLAACIVPLIVKNRIYNLCQMIANIAVLGFWCGQFLDYTNILKFMAEGFALPVGLVTIAMLIAAFIYPLFGHPQHYCAHICPLGSAQQLVAQICGFKIHLSQKTLKALDWLRKIIWATVMFLLWIDLFTGWMDLELFQAFMFESASWWIISAAAIFVALSAVIARPYCRFVCPTGSLFKRAENIG